MKHTLTEIQSVLSTGQFLRLYITVKPGERLSIQVLPEGEKAIPNGAYNLCLNRDAVEVFRWRKGEAGLFQDSWIFAGGWQKDFDNLVAGLLEKEKTRQAAVKVKKEAAQSAETERLKTLLKTYK